MKESFLIPNDADMELTITKMGANIQEIFSMIKGMEMEQWFLTITKNIKVIG